MLLSPSISKVMLRAAAYNVGLSWSPERERRNSENIYLSDEEPLSETFSFRASRVYNPASLPTINSPSAIFHANAEIAQILSLSFLKLRL